MKNYIITDWVSKFGKRYKKLQYMTHGSKYIHKKFLVDLIGEDECLALIDSYIKELVDDIKDKRERTGAGFIPESKWDLSDYIENSLLTITGRLEDHVVQSGTSYCKYTFKCVCGGIGEATGHQLTRLKYAIKSCGCVQRKRAKYKVKTHGKKSHPLHSVWSGMKDRCNNPNNKSFKNYGAKGISVCNEWSESFVVFYDWAVLSGYTKGLSIDRINGDLGYNPDNCRWLTIQNQGRNVYQGRSNTGVDSINFKYYKESGIHITIGWNIPKEVSGKEKIIKRRVALVDDKEENCWLSALEIRRNALKELNDSGFLYDVQITKLSNCPFPWERYETFKENLVETLIQCY